jgi:TolA-binding protein
MYPEYVGDANAYEFLAAAQLAKGDKPGAMATLTAYEKMGGESPEALTKLASLEEELGHAKEAAATLDRINYIYPETEGMHRHLGELWLAQGNYAGAVREYSAVVALKPLDKAEESVLLSLETAPGFRPAQKLLLEIKSGKSKE